MKNNRFKRNIAIGFLTYLFFFSYHALGQLKVNANGNVGIGTNTPEEKLQVNGNIKIKDSIHPYMSFIPTNGGSYWHIQNDQGLFRIIDGDLTWVTRFVIKNNGFVGVGTDYPSERLHVKGNIIIRDTCSPYLSLAPEGMYNWWYVQNDTGIFKLRTDSTPGDTKLSIDTEGNMYPKGNIKPGNNYLSSSGNPGVSDSLELFDAEGNKYHIKFENGILVGFDITKKKAK